MYKIKFNKKSEDKNTYYYDIECNKLESVVLPVIDMLDDINAGKPSFKTEINEEGNIVVFQPCSTAELFQCINTSEYVRFSIDTSYKNKFLRLVFYRYNFETGNHLSMFMPDGNENDFNTIYNHLLSSANESYHFKKGKLYFNDVQNSDMAKKAINEFVYAYKEGIYEACGYLAMSYEALGMENEAVKWQLKGCEEGDALSMYLQGSCYLSGTNGVTKDRNEGFKLIEKSAQLGYSPAIEVYEKLKPINNLYDESLSGNEERLLNGMQAEDKIGIEGQEMTGSYNFFMWLFCILGGYIGVGMAASVLRGKNKNKQFKYSDRSRKKAKIALVIGIIIASISTVLQIAYRAEQGNSYRTSSYNDYTIETVEENTNKEIAINDSYVGVWVLTTNDSEYLGLKNLGIAYELLGDGTVTIYDGFYKKIVPSYGNVTWESTVENEIIIYDAEDTYSARIKTVDGNYNMYLVIDGMTNILQKTTIEEFDLLVNYNSVFFNKDEFGISEPFSGVTVMADEEFINYFTNSEWHSYGSFDNEGKKYTILLSVLSFNTDGTFVDERIKYFNTDSVDSFLGNGQWKYSNGKLSLKYIDTGETYILGADMYVQDGFRYLTLFSVNADKFDGDRYIYICNE